MRKLFFIQFFILLFSMSNYLSAQIGINTEAPNSLTELDIKNLIDSNGKVTPKGIMIPRMNETDRDKIDVTNTESASSLLVYNTDEHCYNYFSKEDEEWKSLCGKLGNAKFDPVDCANIQAKGEYIIKQSMDDTNYLEILVNVIKIGNYSISGVTGNGYYFSGAGTVLELGETILKVPAFGVPKNIGTDKVTMGGIPLASTDCKPEVIVKPMIAEYSLQCNSALVNGEYYKGTSLNGTNTIDIYVNVSTVGSYYITTEQKNGVLFSAVGEFTTVGVQKVTLLPKDGSKPSINAYFDIDILANTKFGQSTCTVTIPVILQPMTYAVIGSTSTYSWGGAARVAALGNAKNFSKDGVLKIKSLTNLWTTDRAADAVSYLTGGYNGGKFPDVVLFNAYGFSSSTALANALSDYILKGGCVIYGSSDGDAAEVNIILTGVFGSAYANAQRQIAGSGTTQDNTYIVAADGTDPIINGTFGNASGRDWGEDNSSTGSIVLTNLPPNSVQVCTAYNTLGKTTVDPGYSIVWYNNKYNFVYFGDSVGASTTSSSTSSYPAYYPSGIPTTKSYGNYGISNANRYVYNSILELNSISWALKKAAVSGINPH